MFLIIGKSKKRIASREMSGECWHCDTPNSMTLDVFQRYRYLYWVPIYPMGKEYESNCKVCGEELLWEELPDDISLKDYSFQHKVSSTPKWVYSGIYAFVLVVLGIWYWLSSSKESDIELLKQPQIGDVYDISAHGLHTFCVVTNVKEDTVSLYYAKRSVEKWYKAEELKEEEHILDSTIVKRSKQELLDMLDDFEISGINRL